MAVLYIFAKLNSVGVSQTRHHLKMVVKTHLALYGVALCVVSVCAIYDCRRNTSSLCVFGTCNRYTGKCESCQTGYQGYNCGIETDLIGVGCSDGFCRNAGTCHGGVCTCTEEWTGNRCNTRRYALNCNYQRERMRMTVRPHIDNFVGLVYMSHSRNTSACNFAQTGNRFRLRLDHTDETCGPTINEGTERKRFVIIQFDPVLQKLYDEYIEFICGVSDVLDDLTFEINVGEITGALIPVTKSLSPLVGDIDLSITLFDTGEGVVSVDMNTHLNLYFALSEEGDVKFDAIRLVNCIASNLPAGSEGYKAAKFIYNSCPHIDLDNVMEANVTNGGGMDASFSFYAFKFLGSDELYITCDVKTCEESTGCEPVSCDEGGEERKKRESGDEPKKVQAKIQVKDPAALSGLRQDAKDLSAVCYETNEMTATLVSLSVALGIVLLICVVVGIVKVVKIVRFNTGVDGM